MSIDDKIWAKNSQCGIKREAAKLSAFSSGKFDKYEYLAGKEILPSQQARIINKG